ncbi:VOC family protein [Streptomyces chilikensis]|uniref:VOC family protein n=1 Tax=Streptomyces chilikensis TaxID=1194079 RepID=A0ABV3EVT7_9ACTN
MLTTAFVPGSPNWIDLGTPDLDGATAFYGGLFGWRFRSAGPDAGGSGFFTSGGRTVAGGTELPAGAAPPSWTVYFRSDDVDATARAVRKTRGRVVVEPGDVTGKGRTAVLADPMRAPFGVRQPGTPAGLDVAGEDGALCWVELHTTDVAGAAGFYHSVLGWETSSVAFPGGRYTCVNPAGAGEEGTFGGVVGPVGDPVEAGGGSYWLPYFAVADVDAVAGRARERGGAVRLEPTDVAGVGRTARLADPCGARFAVLRPDPVQG